MDGVGRAWDGDWRAKVRERVRSMGCATVADFLGRYPSEPYFRVARRLGDDVAAAQLSRMQFEEVAGPDGLRRAAMDGFSREIAEHLKRGWGVGRHADFNTAGAYGGWMALLQLHAATPPQLIARGEAVWRELKALDPPQGWSPSGPDDPILVAAFAKGWPSSEAHPVPMEIGDPGRQPIG